MSMTLQRLVLDYRSGELVLRVLYSTQDGPDPNTKARARHAPPPYFRRVLHLPQFPDFVA
jgi:hypothetical protein